jgi:hypothetical protein
VHGLQDGGSQLQFIKSHLKVRHPWRLGIGLYGAVGTEPVKGRRGFLGGSRRAWVGFALSPANR